MKKVIFTVLGDPVGKGRPKFDTRGPYVKAVTPKKTANYETVVRMEYQSQCEGIFFDKESALEMRVIAYKAIPQGTSRRKREQMLSGAIRPGKKPDWDNVGKIICDALNGVAFRDDTQIVDGRVIKYYADQPKVVVEMVEVASNG